MAKGGSKNIVLVVDDEPEYLRWVEEFLNSRKLKVQYATRLSDAIREISARDFRLFLVDMNIPSAEEVDFAVRSKHPLSVKYPGLAFAIEARNMGYGAHSVIAYTVHDDEGIDAELNKLHARYVLKGRPEALKKVIDASLRPEPVPSARVKRLPSATKRRLPRK
jgi:CheY-like chemotaxis protein